MAITLNANEIYSALSNQILAIETYSNNIAGTYDKLLQGAKKEAGMYGDSVLKIAVDCLTSTDWTNDSEAANLLALNRAAAPDVQRLVIDKFRKIWVTTDDYMSKRAFGDEYAFQSFNSVVLQWLTETRRIYEATTYNAFIGTEVSEASAGTAQNPAAIAMPAQVTHYYDGTNASGTDADIEANARLEAQKIAEVIANILFNAADVGTEYNDLGFVRSYNPDDLVVVWNAAYANKIKKVDVPTIFNNAGLTDKFDTVLPARYFGNRNSSSKVADGTATRSLIEQVIGTSHYFAGDLIKSGETAPAGTSYQEDAKVICKIMHKDSVPYLTSFTASTEFFNPRSLTKNNYLIFGHNTLQHLKQYPFITVKEA